MYNRVYKYPYIFYIQYLKLVKLNTGTYWHRIDSTRNKHIAQFLLMCAVAFSKEYMYFDTLYTYFDTS